MTWQDLLNRGRIEKHKTSRAELGELRGVVARDLADAAVARLSADRRFATAYNAALQSAKMVIACCGYRVRGVGAHHITFECLKLGMGQPVHKIARFLDQARRKRNIADYDAAERFFKFIETAWPKETLEENLDFVAEAIGRKARESSRDAIRRFFVNEFLKDHLKRYKKRPIYWLFTSGKQKALQCLVYLHRYNEGTLARMRTEYVIPLQGRINNRIDMLNKDKDSATSTSAANKIRKQITKLEKQAEELRQFDEKLRHYADMKIKLDLDDGVKVNYGKFGDLLAEVKAVTGKK